MIRLLTWAAPPHVGPVDPRQFDSPDDAYMSSALSRAPLTAKVPNPELGGGTQRNGPGRGRYRPRAPTKRQGAGTPTGRGPEGPVQSCISRTHKRADLGALAFSEGPDG